MSIDNNTRDTIILESFASPTHAWAAMNDPVMGGKSYSTVSVANGLSIFDGEVVDVPFLHAPGFITMRGNGDYSDVSSCDALQLTARASEPYAGYRVSFGERHVPGNRFARGYKADFEAPVGSDLDFATITIPFHDFTVRWDDATGDAVISCEDNKDFCPDTETLKNVKTISLWGEGVAGRVHLEIESIQATGCSKSNSSFSSLIADEGITRVTKPTGTDMKSEDNGGAVLTTPVLLLLAVGVAVMGTFVRVRAQTRRSRNYHQDLDKANSQLDIV